MLRIAKLTDYATGLMAHMARSPDRRISAQQLSQETGLPAPTVANLLKRLTRAGLIFGTRGVAGGYSLSKNPGSISMADVITAIEGPVALTDCALATGICGLEAGCTTRAHWRLINQAVRVALEAVSLADMAKPAAPARGQYVKTPRKPA
ncbi:MAG: SUF system Fe-S cluster assembly regulator [Thiobacillus sp.]|nr:SUF system Fe-S cluster assembly regulator [Thiobacillus sp.]